MRSPLDKSLRKQLERAVEKARDIAELAAREELERLAVGESRAPDYLTDLQRELRNRLRAHARQLGDTRRANGEQGITLLVTEVAYQNWHRMLFSRFLAENNLLMYEDGVTPLSIRDCFDLAEEETDDSSNGWRYAASYAANMLPQVFRDDSPVFELTFSPNHQKQLEQLLEGLDEFTFQAQDSLGWVYQFWQSKRKDEVNASEVKIGARELSPVTQLFTEPYMVSFLLDNALGAWWANQVLSEQDYATAQSEQALRDKAAIDGVPLNYLRFVKIYTPEQQDLLESDNPPEEKPEPEGVWEPAAGKFEQWPDDLAELKILDPCCGSGHFLVSVFLMLVPIRIQREGLDEQQAIDAVLSQNIFGLELDERCVEIAAFALALEAWRYPTGGCFRQLPELHLACSGLSVKAAKEEWKQLGLGKKNLTIALDWMHKEFSDAQVLGSLINPAKSTAAGIISWDELSATLEQALEQEANKEHESEDEQQSLEATVAAQGMAKAATMLAGKYQWVVTNVPYLARGKQGDTLKDFIEKRYPAGKNDLATAFLDRCIELCVDGGSSSVVLPQNWLFLTSYRKFREKLLAKDSWKFLARMGAGAFDTISGEVVKAVLISITRGNFEGDKRGMFAGETSRYSFRGLDVSESKSASGKAESITIEAIKSINQKALLESEDCVVTFENLDNSRLLSHDADFGKGSTTGDGLRFLRFYFEYPKILEHHVPWLNSPSDMSLWSGRSQLCNVPLDDRDLNLQLGCWLRGHDVYGRKGVVVNKMRKLEPFLYNGEVFDDNICPICPKDDSSIPAAWAYVSSKEYHFNVRAVDQALKVTAGTITKVPFDFDRWKKVSDERFPNGLPDAFTNDPIQWIFHGHPCGSVIWDEGVKWTAKSNLRTDETVLHVAIARLLGYQWPAELDSSMELADEQRECVEKAKELLPFVDEDGIVCLPAVRGEKAADQRLEELLQVAFGHQWSSQTRDQLMGAVGCKSKTLGHWLQEKFFEQHCKLFKHRPFIWHICDGLRDGFSALVNYHQLDKKNLERLIYTYLDDWIRTQTHQQNDGVDGASERLNAAQSLKQRLENILEGEAPYDIFVRWKRLDEQPIGWDPDLNDGVRLNIRPFTTAEVLRHNKKPKLNIHWNKDRGKDVESAPWYTLGLEYGGKEGDRINEHHLLLAEKQASRGDKD